MRSVPALSPIPSPGDPRGPRRLTHIGKQHGPDPRTHRTRRVSCTRRVPCNHLPPVNHLHCNQLYRGNYLIVVDSSMIAVPVEPGGQGLEEGAALGTARAAVGAAMGTVFIRFRKFPN